jgi:hypothetical protein
MDRIGPNPSAWPPRRGFKRWVVVHPAKRGWHMPTKLVISVAAEIAGIALGPRQFGPDEAVPWLQSHCGFQIIDLNNP